MMNEHFDRIADRYRSLRITDPEPIDRMVRELSTHPSLSGADVGCGAGRYDMKLFERLGQRLFLYCVDRARPMLDQLETYLKAGGIGRFTALQGTEGQLPLNDRSLNFVMTLNAIHHFDVVGFLKEVRRVLLPDGLVFIYTRWQDQNRRSIWGRLFPGFAEKEFRLFHKDQLLDLIRSVTGFRIDTIESFRYEREATMETLLERVNGKHYSTFSLYGAEELQMATERFAGRLRRFFSKEGPIRWIDENAMVILRLNS